MGDYGFAFDFRVAMKFALNGSVESYFGEHAERFQELMMSVCWCLYLYFEKYSDHNLQRGTFFWDLLIDPWLREAFSASKFKYTYIYKHLADFRMSLSNFPSQNRTSSNIQVEDFSDKCSMFCVIIC